MPWLRSLAQALRPGRSLVVTMPPSPVAMVLTGWNEKQARVGVGRRRRPARGPCRSPWSVPRAWQASSTTRRADLGGQRRPWPGSSARLAGQMHRQHGDRLDRPVAAAERQAGRVVGASSGRCRDRRRRTPPRPRRSGRQLAVARKVIAGHDADIAGPARPAPAWPVQRRRAVGAGHGVGRAGRLRRRPRSKASTRGPVVRKSALQRPGDGVEVVLARWSGGRRAGRRAGHRPGFGPACRQDPSSRRDPASRRWCRWRR